MKTAVEWLANEIQEQLNMFSLNATLYQPTIDKAKEMEKEQIIQAFENGEVCTLFKNEDTSVKYYNETFKK